MTTALVVDDEPNLVDYLVIKLAKLWPELDVVGTCLLYTSDAADE